MHVIIIFMINNESVFHGLGNLSRFFLKPKYAYVAEGSSYTDGKSLTQARLDFITDIAKAPAANGFAFGEKEAAKLFDHLDKLVQTVGLKLADMRDNPDAAFDHFEIISHYIGSTGVSVKHSLVELFTQFTRVRDYMQSLVEKVPEDVAVKLANLIQESSHYFGELIQNIQAQVSNYQHKMEAKAD